MRKCTMCGVWMMSSLAGALSFSAAMKCCLPYCSLFLLFADRCTVVEAQMPPATPMMHQLDLPASNGRHDVKVGDADNPDLLSKIITQ